jgi:hypothetical protein
MLGVTVKLEGDRYVARFAPSAAVAGLVEAAGFRWDPVNYQWWTTDPNVIGRLDRNAARREPSAKQALSSGSAQPWIAPGDDKLPPIAASRGVKIIYECGGTRTETPGALDPAQPLLVQLRSILARPPGTPANASKIDPNHWRDLPAIGPGWVYALSNEAHPHLVKIGHSTDSPESRAAEIHSTGVPLPFVVEFMIYVEECGSLEAAVHERLKDSRVNPRREFFRMAAPEAATCIAELAVERATFGSRVIAYVRENDTLKRIVPSTGPTDDGAPPGRRRAA